MEYGTNLWTCDHFDLIRKTIKTMQRAEIENSRAEKFTAIRQSFLFAIDKVIFGSVSYIINGSSLSEIQI